MTAKQSLFHIKKDECKQNPSGCSSQGTKVTSDRKLIIKLKSLSLQIETDLDLGHGHALSHVIGFVIGKSPLMA